MKIFIKYLLVLGAILASVNAAAVDCSNLDAYKAGNTYTSGNKVTYLGKGFKARQWTQDTPVASDWGPWQGLGNCDVSSSSSGSSSSSSSGSSSNSSSGSSGSGSGSCSPLGWAAYNGTTNGGEVKRLASNPSAAVARTNPSISIT